MRALPRWGWPRLCTTRGHVLQVARRSTKEEEAKAASPLPKSWPLSMEISTLGSEWQHVPEPQPHHKDGRPQELPPCLAWEGFLYVEDGPG